MAAAYGIPQSPLIERNTPKSDFVPRDFTEMYRHYYVYVLRLLVTQGIDPQRAEDVAQTIFIKMDEKGLLEQFDPDRETANGRPAVFRTLLSGFVLKYAMGFRKRQGITNDREPTLVDIVYDASTTTDNEALTWIEVYGPQFEEEYADVTDAEFFAAVRAHLATVKGGRKDSQLDMVAFFDEVSRQVMDDGKYSTSELMAKFSVTRTTIHNWLEKLRIEVAKVSTDDD